MPWRAPFLRFVDRPARRWAFVICTTLSLLANSPVPAKASTSGCAQAGIELVGLRDAVTRYLATYGTLPATATWFPELARSGLWTDSGAKSVPVDPWGRPYVYARLSDTQFDLRSRGDDGIIGTSDDLTLSNSFRSPDCHGPARPLFGCGWSRR